MTLAQACDEETKIFSDFTKYGDAPKDTLGVKCLTKTLGGLLANAIKDAIDNLQE